MDDLQIIQITNIPIQVTKDQMYAMFECIGDIEDIQLYPKKRCTPFQSRICFIKFLSAASVELALFLNGTHLMDRLLQVTPLLNDKKEIPNEKKALEILMNDRYQLNFYATEVESKLVSNIQKVSIELDRDGLPPYPSLPFNCEPAKVEEIRRTIVVSNLDESISGQQILDYFSAAGEVKYVRFCKRNSDGEICCLVEFSKHESVIQGLRLNNSEIFKGWKIKVYHSVHAIEKSMEVILNGVVINRLASSLIEAACQESSERHSEKTVQDHHKRSSFLEYSKSNSPPLKRSHKYKKYKHERLKNRSKKQRSRSNSCSRRSRSQEKRRHPSREGRKRSYDKSERESKRSCSKEIISRSSERSSRCEESKSKDRSSEKKKKL